MSATCSPFWGEEKGKRNSSLCCPLSHFHWTSEFWNWWLRFICYLEDLHRNFNPLRKGWNLITDCHLKQSGQLNGQSLTLIYFYKIVKILYLWDAGISGSIGIRCLSLLFWNKEHTTAATWLAAVLVGWSVSSDLIFWIGPVVNWKERCDSLCLLWLL